MKKISYLLLLAAVLGTAIPDLAAVPVRWTAETSRVQPIALDAWRGDTLALECTHKSYGQPVAIGAATASLMWQTNGMGSAWWQTNATVSADGVIRATWSPSMDPGAPAVAFFLPVQTGDGASYRAAGTLRFRPSPGAGAQIAELPQPGGTLDFGEFNLVNAPWATLAAANEAISAAVTSATGALVIPPPVDLGPYATTGYVAGAISSATGSIVIPPPVDLTPYATTGSVSEAVQTSSNALAGQIQAVSNAAMPRAEMGVYATQSDVSTAIAGIQIPSLSGYATEQYVSDYFSTNYTPPDLSSYASRSYADSAASNAQAAAIAAIPSLSGYATESYVADYFATNYTPPDLSSYASRSYADSAASNAQAAAIAAIPSLSGYATEQYVSDYFSTNYTPPDLSSYASRSYADSAASNAQAAAIAAIPSLSGYATQSYVADYFATNYTPPDLSSYASRSYADSAASNAQAAAIAAIPSLAGYATEQYAQNAASSAASDALSAAQAYARDLSWAASEGNTRLVSLDGTIWQDATGTVWQVSYVYGWSGTVIDLQTSAARPITFYYAGKTATPTSVQTLTDYWSAGAGTNLYFDADMAQSWELWITNVYHDVTNGVWQPEGPPYPTSTATNLSFNTEFEEYFLFYQPVALATNPVDRVLYASDAGDAATADRALSYGTTNYWTDATGCVWSVVGVGTGVWTFYSDGTHEWEGAQYYENDTWIANCDGYNAYAAGGEDATSLDFLCYENGARASATQTVEYVTKLVGRVALTNDIPAAVSADLTPATNYANQVCALVASEATNYTDAVAAEFENGTREVDYASDANTAFYLAGDDDTYTATDLIRESTNAATAVSSSLVRYKLATPGEWEFSGGEVNVQYSVGYYPDPEGDQDDVIWQLFDMQGAGELSSTPGDSYAMSLTFSYIPSGQSDSVTVTATRASLPGHLFDRAVNAVEVTGATTITLPALSHPGQARDFILLLDIPSSVTNTVPAITNLLTFTASGTETVHYYVDGDDPSTATFPLPTSPGTWSYSFSEFKASWFAVSLKPIVEAVAPGGAQ